ncbi:MAG: TIM barrel protein [Acidobacteriota bacterium]|nr:TIM barrel protein [Acidobacteriota bacterium]
MPVVRVGNAPCSWGTLEFEEAKAEQIAYGQMLDELAETGYTGTELGDWGYMPSEPAALRRELNKRGVIMLGAFVPVALKENHEHENGIAAAIKTAKLLAAVASEQKPYLVLADKNGTAPKRTQNAGRIAPAMGLSDAEWKVFGDGANKIAQAVHTETGLRTVFHHHCAGYVETPDEIARFLELTDPQTIGLVFDTGHYVFGAQDCDAVHGLERFQDRVWYVHLKDCQPEIARQSRANQWDYFESLRHGIFCELGRGCVDFPGVLRWLAGRKYDGYMLVEQDILPGMGLPKESARRNREYLRSIEHCFA